MPQDSRPAPHDSKTRYWRRPLDADRVKVTHGDIHIVVDRCKGCRFCVEYCPRDVLEMSLDFNVKGYHYPMVKQGNACVDCRLCELLCPEFAIFCIEKEAGTEGGGKREESGE